MENSTVKSRKSASKLAKAGDLKCHILRVLQLSASPRHSMYQATIAPPFPLLKLPGELRAKIYRYALAVDPWQARTQFNWALCTELLRTNRQIRSEALPLLYQNDWVFLSVDEDLASEFRDPSVNETRA